MSQGQSRAFSICDEFGSLNERLLISFDIVVTHTFDSFLFRFELIFEDFKLDFVLSDLLFLHLQV